MEKGHVAVLPFPFSSHPMAALTLVCRLAQAAPDIQFSFFNTSNSNAKLLPRHGGDHHDQFGLGRLANVKLYGIEDGIPLGHVVSRTDQAEAPELFLKSLPENFRKAMAVAEAETGRNITCLLTDALLSTVLAEIAEELRVPWIAIWPASPCALSALVHVALIRERFRAVKSQGSMDESFSLSLDFVPGLSATRFSDHQPQETIIDDDLGDSLLLNQFCDLGQVLPRAAAVVLSSFRKLNPNDLNLDLESKFKTLLNVGFLTISIPPPPVPQSDSDPTGCLSWLDKQRPKSVAYISFGTLGLLSEEEIIATAEALEESRVPFLWSLPKDLQSFLPNGFVERINTINNDYNKQQGKIVAWTNQVQILGHDSTGVHVTHCGYNSISESIVNGVPMICRPFWADNFMNARMVENVWGIGVGVEGGIITKSGLVKALDLVLGREEGKKIKERFLALKEAVWEGSGPSGSATQDFKALVELITSASTTH